LQMARASVRQSMGERL